MKLMLIIQGRYPEYHPRIQGKEITKTIGIINKSLIINLTALILTISPLIIVESPTIQHLPLTSTTLARYLIRDRSHLKITRIMDIIDR